jgi:hypothetical protein
MDSPDAPKTLSPESLSPDKDGWLLIGFLALLFCWNLGRVELSVTDEARSAVIVRDMVEDGHWLLPRTPDGYLCEKAARLLRHGGAARDAPRDQRVDAAARVGLHGHRDASDDLDPRAALRSASRGPDRGGGARVEHPLHRLGARRDGRHDARVLS